ncbi:UDP-glucose/GDP-mannose dehydrogenase family protein [Bacillus luteolus]|uniref:UDP-glucose 6-dehydrogenase n=1 Tax=Litchfieldia luteola TaxID=682179 RepID=A0ABR9QGK1_9BACI|nr:UDP-glucose/GDP-mannose dehydrogenase family protein [Cytobacillus luteolus]MBE4907627.1 UDP-glucose/GDP-mannose dehydrogenase family protein [Cytobacillus luteolus]MBP1941078.1 UDPglucose 6-dehydrogenase [Cytobacillus luteolus]
MRKIAIVGTGYVGLVTGVCLAEIGHQVTCIDNNVDKIATLLDGKSPIYEPGLEKLIHRNMAEKRLEFTTNHREAFFKVEVIYLAVGTPQNRDGSANLDCIFQAAREISEHVSGEIVVVVKSTVPVGTNDKIKQSIEENALSPLKVDVVSNPEFLREGHAIYDTFHGDRIVIGSSSKRAAAIIAEINEPFNIPIIHTDVRSAEMIKYASNAFLATKISFINEISTICEKVGANIEDVAYGMGQDSRIGSQFLKAGIGYGGSCFPKDTKALVQIAGNVKHTFDLLESVIRINNHQQLKLVEKALLRFGSLKGMRVAILGLAFKPNTDDVREAASIVLVERLLEEGGRITVYDPVAMDNARKILMNEVNYADSLREALYQADMALIVTEWDEIKEFPLEEFEKLMATPIIFDGRNCYRLEDIEQYAIEYHSIGRAMIKATQLTS